MNDLMGEGKVIPTISPKPTIYGFCLLGQEVSDQLLTPDQFEQPFVQAVVTHKQYKLFLC
jgi:hypothetical protein